MRRAPYASFSLAALIAACGWSSSGSVGNGSCPAGQTAFCFDVCQCFDVPRTVDAGAGDARASRDAGHLVSPEGGTHDAESDASVDADVATMDAAVDGDAACRHPGTGVNGQCCITQADCETPNDCCGPVPDASTWVCVSCGLR